jgi:RNA polymerase sigma factor (sigma-70 family)
MSQSAPLGEPSDAELVQACRRGEAQAWEALVNRYQRLIYSIPRRAGLDDEAAAEVFQKTYAALVRKLDTLAQPERVRAWLVTTAKRESWRLSRIAARTVPLPTGGNEETELDLPDDGPLPDEIVQRLDDQHTVRQALAAIDAACRRLLAALYLRPETPAYAELAAELGLREGSIGPTRARCLQKLQRELGKLGFDIG